MSADALSIMAVMLVLALLLAIGGICIAATVHSQTRSTRVLFVMLGCITMIAFALTITLLR